MKRTPHCRMDDHPFDLLDNDWWLAPNATPEDAAAWVARAVDRLGAGYHADTPAKDYGKMLEDARDRACYDLALALAHAILDDRIHEVGLREFQRRGWAPPAPVKPHELVPGKLFLKLFHGRDRMDQKMEDWGFDGPTFGPLQYAHMTYGCDLKVALEGSADADFTLTLTEGLVAHAGKFYGDWSVFVATPEMVKNPRENARSVVGLMADLSDACDSLDDLGRCSGQDDRHECLLDALERIAKTMEALLNLGVPMTAIADDVHEAEDAYNGHYGELTDTTLTATQEQRLQALPYRFDAIDTLNHRR